MPFFVYILFSKKLNRYYVGYTNNLERRLDEHQRGKTRYAKQGKPWKLVYSETFDTRAEAVQRENKIKKMKSRKYIESLIQLSSVGSEHPD